eukprot:CAMPEP_0194766994 /NCGR_PEP_ID=MMETSP0323_2-20130528/34024_1 /TAXON_ID=2866 ORGANISM="Crypthecodinium cohnii, Strain Seligo" /NCGR_SAMPLE_ID=MMETSP0323_2 /ASSEMBLY_ACC=CAM_ASM_000346 /LENGTH=50 /DNA_ID=CAMNT_0039698365 /DNA_START=420 /DNA_END=572 /DNA_ORIENTATION=-
MTLLMTVNFTSWISGISPGSPYIRVVWGVDASYIMFEEVRGQRASMFKQM